MLRDRFQRQGRGRRPSFRSTARRRAGSDAGTAAPAIGTWRRGRAKRSHPAGGPVSQLQRAQVGRARVHHQPVRPGRLQIGAHHLAVSSLREVAHARPFDVEQASGAVGNREATDADLRSGGVAVVGRHPDRVLRRVPALLRDGPHGRTGARQDRDGRTKRTKRLLRRHSREPETSLRLSVARPHQDPGRHSREDSLLGVDMVELQWLHEPAGHVDAVDVVAGEDVEGARRKTSTCWPRRRCRSRAHPGRRGTARRPYRLRPRAVRTAQTHDQEPDEDRDRDEQDEPARSAPRTANLEALRLGHCRSFAFRRPENQPDPEGEQSSDRDDEGDPRDPVGEVHDRHLDRSVARGLRLIGEPSAWLLLAALFGVAGCSGWPGGAPRRPLRRRWPQ